MAGSDGGPSGVSVVALRVLARARVAEVLPLATRWALDDSEASEGARWAAIEALGLLGDRAASRTLREVLSRPGSINSGWTKRLAASALARLGDVDALEVLLDDADWFARLGVAEALVLLDPQTATQLRRRVAQDVDPRVRAAAQK